ncbi:unnamed protein product [Linum tenue]|uniref:Uncharacterized protein n=1 Tax=Linum tenue TaxID=586396 RepID=A0AAV0QYN3_9ROSI|nr:unnamed protein product [Linum tenue]
MYTPNHHDVPVGALLDRFDSVVSDLPELRRFRKLVLHGVMGQNPVGESVVEFDPDPPRRRNVGAGNRRGWVAGVGGELEGGCVWFRGRRG